jgi:pyrroline-5-carboxylate reductase
MPNTPAAIGKGMMVVFAKPQVPAGELAFITDLLSTSGAVAMIADEGLMDAVTAVYRTGKRSEERRVGKECNVPCRSRRSPEH